LLEKETTINKEKEELLNNLMNSKMPICVKYECETAIITRNSLQKR